jgi:F-type H+-transporting ATPase subunit epsilon
MFSSGKEFEFELVSPEQILFRGKATMVVLPATTGALGILADHAPTVVTLARGIIEVYNNDDITHRLFVGGGFANITEQSCLTMANEAISVQDINEDELQQYIKNVEAAIEKTVIEEERQGLLQNASIARAKIDIIKMLQPEKPAL